VRPIAPILGQSGHVSVFQEHSRVRLASMSSNGLPGNSPDGAVLIRTPASIGLRSAGLNHSAALLEQRHGTIFT
jgi:hypothetical protein